MMRVDRVKREQRRAIAGPDVQFFYPLLFAERPGSMSPPATESPVPLRGTTPGANGEDSLTLVGYT
jgi:hypothetical protein